MAGDDAKVLFYNGFSYRYALVTTYYTFMPSSGLRRAETSRLDGTPPAGSSSRHNQRLARKASSTSSAQYNRQVTDRGCCHRSGPWPSPSRPEWPGEKACSDYAEQERSKYL